MPPSDTTPPQASAPTPAPQPPKQPGFWAKLFGKKSEPAITAPAPGASLTPEPRLDDPAGDITPPAPATPAEPSLSQPPVDPAQQIGAVESTTENVTDTEGGVISPSLAVPDSLQNSTVGENPTLPVSPEPQQQPVTPVPQPQPTPPLNPPVAPQNPPTNQPPQQ